MFRSTPAPRCSKAPPRPQTIRVRRRGVAATRPRTIRVRRHGIAATRQRTSKENATRRLVTAQAVLQDHPNDLKALYRGGRALIGVKDYDGARSLFERCLDLDKSCAEAKRGVRDVDRLVKGEGQTKGGFRPLKGLAVAGGGFGCDSRGKWHDRDAGDDGAPSAKKKPVVNPSVDKRTGYGQMAASREMLAMMEDDDVSGVD